MVKPCQRGRAARTARRSRVSLEPWDFNANFPMAHIRLSSIFSTAAEFERAARHAKQAFEQKDLVGERERLAIEYGYTNE